MTKNLSLLVLFFCFCLASPSDLAFAIKNGFEVRDVKNPYSRFSPAILRSTVGLVRQTSSGPRLVCSGTIVGRRTILTAAHCIFYSKFSDIRELRIAYGQSLRTVPLRIKQAKILSLELRLPSITGLDSALLVSDGDLPSELEPVKAFHGHARSDLPQAMMIAGYGLTEDLSDESPFNRRLRMAGTNQLDVLVEQTSDTLLSFDQGKAGFGTSSGDSGGPLYLGFSDASIRLRGTTIASTFGDNIQSNFVDIGRIAPRVECSLQGTPDVVDFDGDGSIHEEANCQTVLLMDEFLKTLAKIRTTACRKLEGFGSEFFFDEKEGLCTPLTEQACRRFDGTWDALSKACSDFFGAFELPK